MSYRALHWAWEQDLTPAGKKFVLVALADHADEEDSCYPGQERLAEMTGQGVKAVGRHLKALEEEGYFHREQRRKPDGTRSSDRFQLHVRLSGSAQPTRQSVPTNPTESPVAEHEPTGQIVGVTPRELLTPSGEPPDTATAAKTAKRGTRVPDPFTITEEMARWASAEGWQQRDAERVTEAFVDYWRAQPGAKGVKVDWPATWRNWLRRDRERRVAAPVVSDAWSRARTVDQL